MVTHSVKNFIATEGMQTGIDVSYSSNHQRWLWSAWVLDVNGVKAVIAEGYMSGGALSNENVLREARNALHESLQLLTRDAQQSPSKIYSEQRRGDADRVLELLRS